ncbi:hypothetical protein [Oceanobacillus sp. E9]|uniref:hypothetical protein n=1 Tax=Oceanobacillus sp. E9 TaxID=1742575 RepID=UPI001439F7C0|nr:hypothetical protein [Oceanobacillus sp. E9]
MKEDQANEIIALLKLIYQELETISSNTSGTEHNVSMLDHKFDELKDAIQSND